MDEQAVREHAQALCDALVAGDMERASEDFSNELRQRFGEVVALLPLPSSEATVVSVNHGGAGYNVVIRLTGETGEVMLQTRWKDSEGRPTVVEASHLSRNVIAAETGESEGTPEGDAVSWS